MKKNSYYNFLIENGEHPLLYNVATDEVMALTLPLAKLFNEYKDRIDELEAIHPTFYEALSQKGMAVDEQTDETEQIIAHWNREETNPTQFTITVLPTLNCNLRCWYCYEKHREQANMSEEVRQRIMRLIDRLASNGELKHLHLDFFGGEPLLGFRQTVLPILQYARRRTTEAGIRLSMHFTTNGVLLTEETIKTIQDIRPDYTTTFQITLDGNREKHDATRHKADGGPTFDTIIANIHRALRAGMAVNNRFNFTGDNVDTLVDIMKEYADLTDDERKRLHLDFQQVWQDRKNSSKKKAFRVMEQFRNRNFCVNIYNQFNKERCYAEYENKLVVNYNGDLYKCTARDFIPELREGVLNEDGTCTWNERYRRRMALKDGNATCRKCRVFPLCHGRCSQAKIESAVPDSCIAHRSEEEKKELVKERLRYLLMQYQQTATNQPPKN